MTKKNLVEENRTLDVSALTEREISSLLFKDAGVSELRGLSDVFSLEQIQTIAESHQAGSYREHAMYLLAYED